MATKEQVTIVRALNILDADKVITAQQSYEAFGLAYLAAQAKSEVRDVIRYSDEILRSARESNREAGTDFRLVYLQGMSLVELRDKVGTDTDNQPCVYNFELRNSTNPLKYHILPFAVNI